MAKAYEELELQDDFMFGVIMRDPKYCKPFLETILGIKIRKLEYPESQKTIDLSAGAKGVRLDVYVEDEKNTVFDMEMQVHIKRNLAKRMRYYQGMIDLNILEKGGDYNELKRVMSFSSVLLIPAGRGVICTASSTCVIRIRR
jgi:predicted transposase/invertase (TIGR01784 family)